MDCSAAARNKGVDTLVVASMVAIAAASVTEELKRQRMTAVITVAKRTARELIMMRMVDNRIVITTTRKRPA